jgi:hypothetical protein
MTETMKEACSPKAAKAISANGADDRLNLSHPSTLIAERATKMWRTMLADMARIRPLGMFFSRSFVSSESLTISSKPIKIYCGGC